MPPASVKKKAAANRAFFFYLCPMFFFINKSEIQILEQIREAAASVGYPAYIVGGYVRDRLLARPSKDMDIVCVGSGIALAEALANRLSPRPRVVTYSRFGTAMLRHGDLDIEFVGARRESYRHDSRNPSVEEGTLEDDQNRRDFTINALAVSLEASNFGQIIDPFHGLRHLEEKLIKTPLEPGQTFSDDPLRMLRAIRFSAQLGFTIEPQTLRAIAEHCARIHIISKERITAELEKIIATEKPSVGFKLLMETGLLPLIFPEMAALQGVEVVEGKGHKDNFYHTLEVLDGVARRTSNIWLRWAAIFHDIAKPPTKRFDGDVGWTFHGHETLGAAMLPRIFKRMRLPLDQKLKYVQKLVYLHLRPISLTKEEVTDSAIRRLLFDAGEELEDLMLLCEADITSKNPHKVRRYLEGYELMRVKLKEVEASDRLRNWQPPVSGELIMATFGLPPTREVGIIKNAIREAILDGVIPNETQKAIEFMIAEGKKLGLSPV